VAAILGLLLAGVSSGYSETIFTFAGDFTADDNIQQFHYKVLNTGQVDVFTTSFAHGGFAPVLSLFDDLGNLQFFNVGSSTNDCVHNGTDPATGACWDARFSFNSVAGTDYLVTLTEDDNFPIGPTLADGFTEQGNGNFTAQPPFNPVVPGGAFLLSGPVQRTADWALTIQSAEPTLTASQVPSQVPEPSTVVLLLTSGGLLALRRKTIKNNR